MIDKVKEELEIVLVSKVEEFHLLGYPKVTIDDVWDCLINKKWKDVKEERPMYLLVDDVLSLSVSDYMNYLSLHTYHESPDWFFQQFEEKKR